MVPSQAIVIRTAAGADALVLSRLAALDSQAPPTGGALLVELDGAPRAALELATGRVVADPFHRTADLVALLRLRAERLRDAARRSSSTRSGRLALRRPPTAVAGA